MNTGRMRIAEVCYGFDYSKIGSRDLASSSGSMSQPLTASFSYILQVVDLWGTLVIYRRLFDLITWKRKDEWHVNAGF
jgi:hypothetical protein